MGIMIIIQQMSALFFLIAIGFLLRKTGVLNKAANALLTRLILLVIMPAAIIMGVTNSANTQGNLHLLYIFTVSILVCLFMAVFALIITALTKPNTKEDKGALASTGMFGNIIYMGLPLVYLLFGPRSMLYAVIFNLVFNTFALSYGIRLIATEKAELSLRLIFNAAMNASIFALLLFVFNVQMPAVIAAPLNHLGGMLTPTGMILLGSILAEMNIRETICGWRIYIAVFVKLILAPVSIFLIASQFLSDPLSIGVIVVLAAVPAAPRNAMLAVHYKGNHKLVSQGIFLSTIFSIITLPLLLYFLQLSY